MRTTTREGEILVRFRRGGVPARPGTPAGTSSSGSASRPLSARAWRVADYPGAVNATIAAAIVRLGGRPRARPGGQPHVRLRHAARRAPARRPRRRRASASTCPRRRSPRPARTSTRGRARRPTQVRLDVADVLRQPGGAGRDAGPASTYVLVDPPLGDDARHARDERRRCTRSLLEAAHAVVRARRAARRAHPRDHRHGALPARRLGVWQDKRADGPRVREGPPPADLPAGPHLIGPSDLLRSPAMGLFRRSPSRSARRQDAAIADFWSWWRRWAATGPPPCSTTTRGPRRTSNAFATSGRPQDRPAGPRRSRPAPVRVARHVLVVTAAGDPDLRELAQRWLAAAPAPDDAFEYAAFRQPVAEPRRHRRCASGTPRWTSPR